MERKQFYVNLQGKQISEEKHDGTAFTIHATEQEAEELRRILNNMSSAEMETFWRAHVPFKPYHDDVANDRYDKQITEAYKMMYTLGDTETKQFIEQSGVLSDRPIDTDFFS